MAAAGPEPMGYFRAVAIDFDGTLGTDGHVSSDALAAVAEARARGVRVLLVTGRTLGDLQAAFPGAEAHLDAVVAENGAVIWSTAGVRLLHEPVDERLVEALAAEGVTFRRGEVLVACAGVDELAVLGALRRLGLDCQLVRNRAELMVLPAGATKGSGLLEALGDLGLSRHNTIGVGDAENDHSLLSACEVGVAVANAVEALRRHADLVLAEDDGEGVAHLLRGDLLAGRAHLHPRRWRIAVGTTADGRPVRLPASQLNLLVAGGTGEGKSYLAGVIAEQLIRLGYALLVVDPEGDHVGLGMLRGVLVVGGGHPLPPPDEIARLIRNRYTSVVLDLSGLDGPGQASYLAGLPAEIEALRRASGLPQWVVVDEAHHAIGPHGAVMPVYDSSAKGYLLVTWQPQELSADAIAGLDAVVALGSPEPGPDLVDITAAVADMPRSIVAQQLSGPRGRGVLAWRAHPRRAVPFILPMRRTPHLRHEHKYGLAGVAPERRFNFRSSVDELTGAVAGNLGELEAEIGRCDEAVLRHHCPRRDFSRWIAGVFHDPSLATSVGAVERTVTAASPSAVVEAARVGLVGVLQVRTVTVAT